MTPISQGPYLNVGGFDFIRAGPNVRSWFQDDTACLSKYEWLLSIQLCASSLYKNLTLKAPWSGWVGRVERQGAKDTWEDTTSERNGDSQIILTCHPYPTQAKLNSHSIRAKLARMICRNPTPPPGEKNERIQRTHKRSEYRPKQLETHQVTRWQVVVELQYKEGAQGMLL